MKRIFIAFGHHNTTNSFNAAIRDNFIEEVKKKGHEVDLINLQEQDLYIVRRQEQLSNGKRGKLIEQSQLAKDTEIAQDEIEMHGVYAIQMRRQYPALKNAWEKYKTVWHLIHGEN